MWVSWLWVCLEMGQNREREEQGGNRLISERDAIHSSSNSENIPLLGGDFQDCHHTRCSVHWQGVCVYACADVHA